MANEIHYSRVHWHAAVELGVGDARRAHRAEKFECNCRRLGGRLAAVIHTSKSPKSLLRPNCQLIVISILFQNNRRPRIPVWLVWKSPTWSRNCSKNMICVRKMFIWSGIRWEHTLLRTRPKEYQASVESLASIQPNRTSKAWDRKFDSIHPMPCLSMSSTQTPGVSSCWKYLVTECRRLAVTSISIPTMVRHTEAAAAIGHVHDGFSIHTLQ